MTSARGRSSTSSSAEATGGAGKAGVPPGVPALLCALGAPPYLAVVGPGGEREALPAASVAGPARFPAVSAGGLVAYVTSPEQRRSATWLTAVAVLDRDRSLLDLLPGVRSQSPPAWSPGGERLALVRAGAGPGRFAVVVVDVGGGEETEVAGGDVTGVAWLDRDTLAVTRRASLERLPLGGGGVEVLLDSEVGERLARYGTDDLYLTFEQPCPGPGGRVALAVAWHAQGRPPREHVVLAEGGRAVPVAAGRYPRWWRGRLLVSEPGGVRLRELGARDLGARVRGAGAPGVAHGFVPVAGLHSAVPAS